jgi:hypothetical protein
MSGRNQANASAAHARDNPTVEDYGNTLIGMIRSRLPVEDQELAIKIAHEFAGRYMKRQNVLKESRVARRPKISQADEVDDKYDPDEVEDEKLFGGLTSEEQAEDDLDYIVKQILTPTKTHGYVQDLDSELESTTTGELIIVEIPPPSPPLESRPRISSANTVQKGKAKPRKRRKTKPSVPQPSATSSENRSTTPAEDSDRWKSSSSLSAPPTSSPERMLRSSGKLKESASPHDSQRSSKKSRPTVAQKCPRIKPGVDMPGIQQPASTQPEGRKYQVTKRGEHMYDIQDPSVKRAREHLSLQIQESNTGAGVDGSMDSNDPFLMVSSVTQSTSALSTGMYSTPLANSSANSGAQAMLERQQAMLERQQTMLERQQAIVEKQQARFEKEPQQSLEEIPDLL